MLQKKERNVFENIVYPFVERKFFFVTQVSLIDNLMISALVRVKSPCRSG